MICLTGDVHNKSLNTKETKLIFPKTEIQLAEEYLKIAEKYDLKVSLFLTGKIFLEEWEDAKKLLEFENVEIGGHTFNAFHPFWIHKISKVLIGSYWPSKRFQEKDIKKTVNIIKERTKRKIKSWRTHSYLPDKNTRLILEKYGIEVWSDIVDPYAYYPYRIGKLTVLPVNLPRDHLEIYHGFIGQNFVDEPIKKFHHPFEWLKIVKIETMKIVEVVGGVATINVHPVCMYLADKFQTFRRLCKFMSQFESIYAMDAAKLKW